MELELIREMIELLREKGVALEKRDTGQLELINLNRHSIKALVECQKNLEKMILNIQGALKNVPLPDIGLSIDTQINDGEN